MRFMSYMISSSALSRSLDRLTLTAPIVCNISTSSCTVREGWGNLTLCGSYGCCNERVMWLHVCSSSSVGVRVSAIMLVPWTASGNAKSPSSDIRYVGASPYGLYWTLIPKWRIWLGLTKVWSNLYPIHISSLNTSMLVSPNAGDIHAVPAHVQIRETGGGSWGRFTGQAYGLLG